MTYVDGPHLNVSRTWRFAWIGKELQCLEYYLFHTSNFYSIHHLQFLDHWFMGFELFMWRGTLLWVVTTGMRDVPQSTFGFSELRSVQPWIIISFFFSSTKSISSRSISTFSMWIPRTKRNCKSATGKKRTAITHEWAKSAKLRT